MILTVDLGTSTTKVVLWTPDGTMAKQSRAQVTTHHPRPGWAEQDPGDWWDSVVTAVRAVTGESRLLDVICFSAARETFVLVGDDGEPLGPGIVWSDRRGDSEGAMVVRQLGGPDAARDRVGLIIDGGSVAAKAAWLAKNEPDRLAAARWLLSPRDVVAWRMTGQVATDWTMASRTGLMDREGRRVEDLAGSALLPSVQPPTLHVGRLTGDAGAELGVTAGCPVVLGAGDRACEVLGTGATPTRPMVSWGTTANVSWPLDAAEDAPAGFAISKGALGGEIAEGGLSAAGAALDWLASLTRVDVPDLVAAARNIEPGSRGVVVLPWFNGARAPWWVPGARASFHGLTPAHGRGELARAIMESVAAEVARSLERRATPVESVIAAAGGTADALWVDILAGAIDRPVAWRAVSWGASVGAALIAAAALGQPLDLDVVNPLEGQREPDVEVAAWFAAVRPSLDALAVDALKREVR